MAWETETLKCNIIKLLYIATKIASSGGIARSAQSVISHWLSFVWFDELHRRHRLLPHCCASPVSHAVLPTNTRVNSSSTSTGNKHTPNAQPELNRFLLTLKRILDEKLLFSYFVCSTVFCSHLESRGLVVAWSTRPNPQSTLDVGWS